MNKKVTSQHAHKRSVKYLAWLLVLVATLCVISGGCGGSSNGGGGAVTKEETVFDVSDADLLLTMDINDNGMPDFLDFNGVSQYHVNNAGADTLGAILEADSIASVAEKTVTVPSMVWLNQLRSQTEDSNLFSVALEGGKEYTFEFSKNLTENLGAILPVVKVYDPTNASLSAVDAEPMAYEIAAYPPENPSILCYTVKPATSGIYIVEVYNGEAVNADAAEPDTASVLFIYEEVRNEEGKAGYYTNFKFQDADGNKTQSININDMICLRQLFLESNKDYFSEVYGWDLPDDSTGLLANASAYSFKNNDDYSTYMYGLLSKLGILPVEDEFEEMTDEELEKAISELEKEESDAPYEAGSTTVGFSGEVAVANNRASANGQATVSGINDEYSAIPASITGISYEEQYEIGKGFLAISNFDPLGGLQADISTAYEQKKADYLKLPAEKQFSQKTESYATFVSSSTQAETLQKASTKLGLSTGAVGVSLGTGESNNLKFGLTSTNLVIHYEVVENAYRLLTAKELDKAWEDSGLYGVIDGFASGNDFLLDFRRELGDYYVAGYQYGACFDAYISITTKTSEQTKTVEQKLSLELNLGDGDDKLTASSDISNTLTNTLKENDARVNIRIVTNGLDKSKPTEIQIKSKSDDIAGQMSEVNANLQEFLTKLKANTDRANYAPVRVQLSRWRSNLFMFKKWREKGCKEARIPITVDQATTIAKFNSRLRNLTGYRNTIVNDSAINKSNTASIEEQYNGLITTVNTGHEKFYADKEAVTKNLALIDDLIPKFKALSDRYVFYTKLILAQESEKKIYDALKEQADKLGEGNNYDYVKQMPFGLSDYGGTSGYDQFPVSEFVTEDINAGKTLHKQYKADAPLLTYRLEWHSNHKSGETDYLESAGAATITAETTDGSEAVFCWVKVNSTSVNRATDRKRELVDGSPAVGKKSVGFEFFSGRGDTVNWNIHGKSMRMRTQDYPFAGLK